MGIPMPLFERFAPGTEWVLTVPSAGVPVGERVRVEVGPDEECNVTVTVIGWESCPCVILNVGVLG